jgi:argininosuccinate lyase
MMSGLPLAYNKDMQEDKDAVFSALDTVNNCLTIFTRMFSTLRFQTDTMRRSAARGFTNATDAADYLAKKGMPFRDAHAIVGKLVLHCLQTGTTLEDLALDAYKKISPAFEEDIYTAISLQTCVDGRAAPGGPAPAAVEEHIGQSAVWLSMQHP